MFLVNDSGVKHVKPSNGTEKNNGNQRSRTTKPPLNLKKGARDYLGEYCNNTSLHGLKYVGGEDRTIYEKILWGVLFLTSVVCCTIMMLKTYQKWVKTPVIVSFSENSIPVWKVPFPAITICPQNPCKQTKKNFTDILIRAHYNNVTAEERRMFGKLSLICNTEILAQDFVEFEEDSVLELFEGVAPTLKDTIIELTWNGKDVADHSEFFTRKLTEDGICYSFNSLAAEEIFTGDMYFPEGFLQENETKSNGWFMEGGYQNNDITNSYPKRVASGGVASGLVASLKVEEDDLDYACKSATQGFKIIIHSPRDITRGLTQYVIAPIDNEVAIAVTPYEMTTSDELKSYTPEDRRCYFASERKLRFFKRYSNANCQMECLTNYTLSMCGCVEYFMPREKGTKICGAKSTACTKKVEHDLLEGKFNADEEDPSTKLNQCGCLPSCFSLEYSTESSQAWFHWKQYFRSLGSEEEHNKKYGLTSSTHVTRISVFFKDNNFLPVQRGELYGITDFLANCGGIFGLFTGFSILSLMEILYYLTVRMWINRCKYGGCCLATPEENEETGREKVDDQSIFAVEEYTK